MTVSNVQNNNKHTYYTPKLFAMGVVGSAMLASHDISNSINISPKLKGSSIATKREFLSGVLSNLDIPHYAKLRKTTISKMIKATQKNVFKKFASKIAILTLLCTVAGISQDLKVLNKPKPKTVVD